MAEKNNESVAANATPAPQAPAPAAQIGIDPATGERKSVTSEGLAKEFGAKRGESLYNEIAIAGGFGIAAHRPALDLTGLKSDQKKLVDDLIASSSTK